MWPIELNKEIPLWLFLVVLSFLFLITLFILWMNLIQRQRIANMQYDSQWKAQCETLLSQTGHMAFIVDMDGCRVLHSKLSQQMYGFPPQNEIADGMPAQTHMIHPDSHPAVGELLTGCLRHAGVITRDIQLMDADGQYRWNRVSALSEPGKLFAVGLMEEIHRQ